MKDGFIQIAAGVPAVHLADAAANAEEIIALMRRAAGAGAHVLVLPELSVTGCSCGDLFRQQTLLDAAREALMRIAAASAEADMLSFIGVPLVIGGALCDCAAAVAGGKILGIVPKRHLPRQSRVFSPAPAGCTSLSLGGEEIPFGAELLFSCAAMPALTVGAEIGEDAFAPIPPSAALCAAGASVIVHLNGMPETVCAAERRTEMITAQSARLCCVYASANAGTGESSTDAVYGGHSLITECGKTTAVRPPFVRQELFLLTADIAALCAERRRLGLFDGMEYAARVIPFDLTMRETALVRPPVAPHPFIPSKAYLGARCARILEIQSHGLARRLEAAHAGGAVIGVSGGLDSTLAMLVTARALDLLGWERTKLTAVTMPCYGTTNRTKSNAQTLSEELGASFCEIPIADAVGIHFRDIGHDPSDHSVVYENAQARERTQVIMDLANEDNSLVIGTGDLSELALGWATYNGDHMSNYGVNAGLPKTLIRRVVEYCAAEAEADGKAALAAVLRDILATPVSPELLPAQDGEISQKTEDIVGPYDLHDFFLWCLVRRGDSPKTIYRLARTAFAGKFDDETIRKWLKIFCRRFFIQQFKRSCLPDGPKIGSVSFSPRTDWQMPSDAISAAWLRECDEL